MPTQKQAEETEELEADYEEYGEAEEAEERPKVKYKKYKNVAVKREGSEILLPNQMSIDDGIMWLQRKKEEEEKEVAITEIVEAFPLDGAYALLKAMSQKYGFVDLIPTPSFFGPRPPAMVGIEVAAGKTVQIPWGRMQIPGVAGFIETGFHIQDGQVHFLIAGRLKRKHQGVIAELARRTRELVRTESIYRGTAIKATFPDLSDENFDPVRHAPKFLKPEEANEEELVFSEEVGRAIQHSVFTPIEKTEQCRKYSIPLKRGILLEGPYGTGKTLTAFVTAKKAVRNGWTFIYLDNTKSLDRAIQFAKLYGPAVIFAEDLDSVLSGSNRTDGMNAILNTIDGVDTKKQEVMVVLTTNHVEKINPAMLRPGRLDAVISVRPPDKEAVQRLLRLYGRGLIPKEEDLSSVGKKLEGLIPALIREVVERSKLSAINRLADGETLEIFQTDLLAATETMIAQNKLVNPNVKPEPHPLQLFGAAMGQETALGIVAAQLLSQNGMTFTKDVAVGAQTPSLETVNLVADSMTNGGKTPEVKKMANRSSKSPTR